MNSRSFATYLIPIAAILCLTPWVGSGEALALGLILSLLVGNPYASQMKTWTSTLLGIAVAGLGAGMNLEVIGRVGQSGIVYTIIGIGSAFLIGTVLGKMLRVEKDTSLLITVGSAICGGSAIAAVAPVIRAKNHEVSVALGTVFILNAVALLLFPWIGHYFDLSETQFGLWSALAIHDTSSVVGATLHYGPHALEVGTTVKLARALWIIPVAVLIGFVRARSENNAADAKKAKKPWFILWFLMAAAVVTWIPTLQPAGHVIEAIAKKLMVLCLFMIGAGLTRETIKAVGIRPFVLGIGLWLLMGTGTLLAVYTHLIH